MGNYFGGQAAQEIAITVNKLTAALGEAFASILGKAVSDMDLIWDPPNYLVQTLGSRIEKTGPVIGDVPIHQIEAGTFPEGHDGVAFIETDQWRRPVSYLTPLIRGSSPSGRRPPPRIYHWIIQKIFGGVDPRGENRQFEETELPLVDHAGRPIKKKRGVMLGPAMMEKKETRGSVRARKLFYAYYVSIWKKGTMAHDFITPAIGGAEWVQALEAYDQAVEDALDNIIDPPELERDLKVAAGDFGKAQPARVAKIERGVTIAGHHLRKFGVTGTIRVGDRIIPIITRLK